MRLAAATVETSGGMWGVLALVVTQLGALGTLYLQGKAQHTANDARLGALEDRDEEIIGLIRRFHGDDETGAKR